MAALSDVERYKNGYRFLHEYLQGKLEDVGKYFVEKNVFTQANFDDILAQRTQHQQCKKFLDELPLKSSMFWGHLMDVIKENIGDNDTVEYLHPNYVKKIVPADKKVCSLPEGSVSPEPDLDCEENLDLEIKVKPCSEIISNDRTYKNDSNPRGLALIINIFKFKNKEKDRHGSNYDEMHLKSLYIGLGYQVIVERDLKATEMVNSLKTFAENEQHKYLCSCIVTILSHGERDGIYGSDEVLVKNDDIYKMFDNHGSTHLQNKPKLFIIQACRGLKEDTGKSSIKKDNISTQQFVEVESTQTPAENEIINLPVRSDMIISYSTLLGYVSLRDEKNGTIFISTIVRVFKDHAHAESVQELLTRVNGIMKKKDTSGYKQQPEFQSTLDKAFYFFPGNVIGT